MSRAVSLLSILMMLCSCSQSARRENRSAEQPDPLQSRIAAYWSGIDPDTVSPDMREQLIVDYLYLIANTDSTTRAVAWPRLNDAIADHPDRTVTDYLGSPDSPLYSPAMLDEYLSQLVAALPPSDAGHARAAYLLKNTRKNRPGHPIADLVLISATGTRSSLHAILDSLAAEERATESSAGALVLFYDPDCDTCDSVIADLSQSQPQGEIIAVSVTDAVKPLPAGWHSFRVSDSEALDTLFYLPALPALYLVDPATRLILRRD